MTTFVDTHDSGSHGSTGRPTRRSVPTVDIAGVSWPLYKVEAIVAAVVAGLVAFVIVGTGQAAMWVAAVALVGVWWVQRIRALSHSRADRQASGVR